MKKIKLRNIPVILLVIVIFVYLTSIFIVDFGIRYNQDRLKKGIPLIGNNWHTYRQNTFSSQVWEPPHSDSTKKSYHSYKKVGADFGTIKYEYDYFRLQVDSLDKGISMGYIYEDENTNPWMIEYYVSRKEKVIYSEKMTYNQALDTLKKYGLLNSIFNKSENK